MMNLIKTAKLIRMLFNIFIYPIFFLLNHLSFRCIFPKRLRRFFDYSRTRMIIFLGAKIGSKVYISKNFFTTSFDTLTFGSNGTIGMNCELYSYGKINIGSNFLIGSNVVIHTSEHIFENKMEPIITQGCIYKPVNIGNNVYLGSNVIILSGVTISSNVIVGSGGIVTKDLDSGWIYGGNPVKKIRLIYKES